MSKEIETLDLMDNKDRMKTTNKLIDELLSQIEPSDLLGKGGIFRQLKKQLVERVLASELEYDLGYSKHSKIPKNTDNRRNGSYEKTIIDSDGHQMTIDVPRDRDGEFEPKFIPKGLRRFSGFDDQVISLYARGMTIEAKYRLIWKRFIKRKYLRI